MNVMCNEMDIIRNDSALYLSKKINKELQELEMIHAKFSVHIEKIQESEFNPNGLDKVEFMICTNTRRRRKGVI